jgi:hypothetical protein
MAYPIIPVVRPERIIRRFFKAPATTGTKGGEQMADTDVIINVSVSILKIQQKSACNINDPKIQNTTKNINAQLMLIRSFKLAMDPTTRQKMRIIYIPN